VYLTLNFVLLYVKLRWIMLCGSSPMTWYVSLFLWFVISDFLMNLYCNWILEQNV